MIDGETYAAIMILAVLITAASGWTLRLAYRLGKAAAVRELFQVLRSSDSVHNRL